MAGIAAASSSSFAASFQPRTRRMEYDVFISFRGVDTRDTFTCHLHKALTDRQIKTFIDYDLCKGYKISPSLRETIQYSYIYLVVLSENYASSKWCLDELTQILRCKKECGRVVIPVFYHIDPSHVRRQLGSYEEAFKKHEKDFKDNIEKVQEWKDALTEVAGLAGFDSHSRSYRDDSQLIQDIVNDVLQKLSSQCDDIEPKLVDHFYDLVGVDKDYAAVESLLGEAQAVGIWGMGGIGKTTLARAIFDRWSHQFLDSCFLENVRERSGKNGQGLPDLRDRLYSSLLSEKNATLRSRFVKTRLNRGTRLIVLDDVSSAQQLDYLLGNFEDGQSCSIIITTRDKNVLESRGVDKIHELKGLDLEDSRQLFCLKAFFKDHSQMGYQELVERAVVYCKGVPLALIVLGSFLHSKSENEWDDALKKLEKIPKQEIQDVLRLSYDGLDDKEKDIFLDIACHFKGECLEQVISILDSCGFYPVIGMRSLHDKAQININVGFVWMHDLIQEMGWEVVRQESMKNPGDRSRLWDFDDSLNVLKDNKGTDKIETIMFDMCESS